MNTASDGFIGSFNPYSSLNIQLGE